MDDSASESVVFVADGLSSSVAHDVFDVPYMLQNEEDSDAEAGFGVAVVSNVECAAHSHDKLDEFNEFDKLNNLNNLNNNKLNSDNNNTAVQQQEPTTKRELIAWWLYYFAYEPVSVVAMVLLIPLLLQELALKAGHLPGDPSAPCTAADSNSCVVFELFGGAWRVTPSAFAYYIIALSVAAQAVTFVSVGALADYGRLRKVLLAGCTFLGVACLLGMLAVRDEGWLGLAGTLTVLLSMFYGTASVFYNAYLPLLVQSHPKYTALLREAEGAAEGAAATARKKAAAKKKEKLGSFISTVGIAAGYCAGIVVICGMIGYFAVFGTDGMAMQVCTAACGLWWLAWSMFPLVALKYRPGPPLPPGANYVSFSWGKLAGTLRRVRQLPTTFAFLLGYFFFSDGYNTMGSAAILIAKQSVNVGLTELTVCALIAPVCALAGTFVCFFVQRTLRASNKAMLVGILCVLGSIPLYCALGLLPGSPVGLRQQWEIYAITAVYGFFIGAVQSFARCLFADLIPPGEEAEFFSLYAVTDKGSAFVGPMAVALLSDWTRETRFGLLFLAALILLPVPFIHKFVKKQRQKG